MTRIRAFLLAIAALFLSHSSALAVNPDEVLKDPALEARARRISSGLRCLVCQNQSIDISDADLAKDLRVIVRERLTAGDSDGQVLDYVVARYGEFVLLKPRFSAGNAMLWGAPFALVLIGGIVMFASNCRRGAAPNPSGLSVEELRQLDEIIGEKKRA